MANYRKNYFCICEGQQETKLSYVEYDHAALFDYDFRKDRFKKSIEKCDKLMRDNAKKGKKKDAMKFYHAYSNVDFDLWMLLHKQDCRRTVTTTDAYKLDIRNAYGLAKDADIKDKKVIEGMLQQITLEDVKLAIQRAEKIRASKLPGDAQKVGDSICYDNPDLSIHEFVKMVLVDCGEM